MGGVSGGGGDGGVAKKGFAANQPLAISLQQIHKRWFAAIAAIAIAEQGLRAMIRTTDFESWESAGFPTQIHFQLNSF
ncbi:MAG: hypothetical protein K8L97_19675 [Anaerolineae bacterium]|nr:hypothetical protein [Anaerolineae bacterium]